MQDAGEIKLRIFTEKAAFKKKKKKKKTVFANKSEVYLRYKLVKCCTCSLVLSFISNLSDDRSTASSKTIPPLNAI
jgi:hypothetical protein